jgi:hypothetical protein
MDADREALRIAVLARVTGALADRQRREFVRERGEHIRRRPLIQNGAWRKTARNLISNIVQMKLPMVRLSADVRYGICSRERRLVDQTNGRWNHFTSWLRPVEALREPG